MAAAGASAWLAGGTGRTTKETAAALFLSPKTLEDHLGHIYQKIEIRLRSELSAVVAPGADDTVSASWCGVSALSTRYPHPTGLWITGYRESFGITHAGRMVSPYIPPPMESATDPVHSASDMRQRWRALMGPLGFGQRLLWIGFVGADCCMYKTMSQLPLGTRPTRWLVEDVMSRLRFVVNNFEEGATVALLLTRPGIGPISHLDRQWSTLLTEVAAEFGVPLQPIFRANDESLVQVEPELESAT